MALEWVGWCMVTLFLGIVIGQVISDTQLPQCTQQTQLVYVNQTDNCLDEVMSILDEADKIEETIYMRERYK